MANYLDPNVPFENTPEINVSPITPDRVDPIEVDASEATTAPPSSQETLDKRSFKIKYGLGDILNKSKDDIFYQLQQGNEPGLREEAAGEVDRRKSAALEQVIKQATTNKGAPLSSDELSGLSNIIKDMSETSDPQTIFEASYAKQFLSQLDVTAANNPDSFLNDAKQQSPEEVAAIMNAHSSALTKREILTTKLQDVEDEIKQQSWLGWGYDQAKSLIPGYTDVQMRQNVPSVGVFSGVGLGANLDKQRQELLRLSPSELKSEIDRIIDPMKSGNPSLAADYLRAIIGQGTRDEIVKDVILPVDLAGLGIGKAGVKTVKTIAVRNQVIKDTKKAAEDMVVAATDPAASKSTIEAASGDLKQSAITRTVTNAVEDARGVPDQTKRGLESLSTPFRTDLTSVKANPGRFGQDIVNRIEESYDAAGPILQKAVDIGKVERLPEVMSNEVAVRAILDNIKDTYKGIKNAVIDMSRPYKESLSNNWFTDMYLGNADGTYFTNRSVAENFIKFNGLGSAEIREGENVAFTKSSRQVAQIESNLKLAQDTIKKIQTRLEENKYGTPEKRTKDEETLAFLRDEAIPNYSNKLTSAKEQKATVEQQGLGYYVKITKPINETDDVVRDYIASTKNTKIPESSISSFLNAWKLGKYRTPEDTLSKADRANRLVTTYNPSELTALFVKNSPAIQRLATSKPARFSKGRQKWDEFQRVIENGQELYDVTGKQKGYFFQSPDELENAYMSWFKRMPDEDEVLAYFEFKRNMEIDRAFRNISEHRNQTRVGAETHAVITTDPDGKSFRTPSFSGVTRKKIGGSTDNVAILGDKYGFEKVRNFASMSLKDKAEFQALIDSGEWKYIELYNPEIRPLQGYGIIGDERVRYVLAKTVETKDLEWEQISRRGGGHVEYDYPYYIKQANVKRDSVSGQHWYEGDTTVMPVQLYKMGSDFAKKLDQVRKLLKDKQEAQARDFSNKNLHINWETVSQWFKGERQADGTWKGARLNLDQPIQVIPKGKSIGSMNDSLEKSFTDNGLVFRNGEKEGSLARQNRIEFSQERDAHDVFTIENKGTAGNPLYSIIPAEKVDPITVLNRGLNKIARSNFMDDYKTMSVEHWLQQAGKYLQATESEIRHSPFYYFREAKFYPGVDPIIKGQLETAKAHIEQLIGQPSDTANKLQRVSQYLADAGESRFGPDSVLANEWDLSFMKDPFKTLRTMAYHAKMGLFNIPQFIVQMGNYSNILGIAGIKYAASGTLGAQLHFWSRLNSNPALIDLMDRMASRMKLPGVSNWKPGEFKEAFEEFKKTGFGNVGGEYAALDDPMNQKLVTQGVDTFLDMSNLFVRNGERNSRYGAWYTAFKEFRDAKPFGRITDQDRLDILQRADLLNINMSRASSSALHSGAMSIPTQFLTYQIRLFELFMSPRLTPTEKFRMFYTNSLLYGIPMGVGLTGLPAADYFRQKMMENGYVVGDNFFNSFMMEGIPSALGAIITGSGDPSAGTWYDFGSRFGTKGLEFLGGVNRSDKSTLDVLGGPAWSIIKGTLEQSDGLMTVMTNLMRPDGEYFQPAVEDFIDPLKEISSVNSAFRTMAALNTERWVSKKESWLADATPFQAVFAGLTSLKDQRIDDIQTLRAAASSQKEFEKEIESRFLREYRRGILATKDGNNEQGQKFFTRAKVYLAIGDYPPERLSSLLSRAANENKSILDKVSFDFYTRQPKGKGIDPLVRTERIKSKQKGEQ